MIEGQVVGAATSGRWSRRDNPWGNSRCPYQFPASPLEPKWPVRVMGAAVLERGFPCLACRALEAPGAEEAAGEGAGTVSGLFGAEDVVALLPRLSGDGAAVSSVGGHARFSLLAFMARGATRVHRDGSGIREVERREGEPRPDQSRSAPRPSSSQAGCLQREAAPIIIRRWRCDAPHATFPSFDAFTALSPRLGPPPPFLEQFLPLHHRPSGRLRGPELFRGDVVAARVSQRFPFDDVAIEAERRIELEAGPGARSSSGGHPGVHRWS